MTDLSRQREMELVHLVQQDPHRWVDVILSGDDSAFEGFTADERKVIENVQLRRLNDLNRRRVEDELREWRDRD
ncbi:hypothetical protein ACO229_06730 [Promicromonospora sp. MS192]|uniref:hypothetical protein n=1 Tax=Promicromonospora sp. MS192 TaxID=3412684 RepID=UPI003C2E893E